MGQIGPSSQRYRYGTPHLHYFALLFAFGNDLDPGLAEVECEVVLPIYVHGLEVAHSVARDSDF